MPKAFSGRWQTYQIAAENSGPAKSSRTGCAPPDARAALREEREEWPARASKDDHSLSFRVASPNAV